MTMREILGPDNPVTLSSASDLAAVLHDQGDYGTAEVMTRRILQSYERTLGKTHPDTITSMSNLASILQDQGQIQGSRRNAPAGSRELS